MNQCIEGCGSPKAPGRSRCWTCYTAYRAASEMSGPRRVLAIDIETTPNEGYFWGLFKQNIGINQITQSSRMLCFSAKWLGEANQFYSEWYDGHEGMVDAAYELVNEADVVLHFYGSKFDMPHLNREFLLADKTPPSPYKQIDLKLAVAKQFKFTSNKLQYVSQALGLAGKNKTDMDLWIDTMAGDPQAQSEMEAYNRQDVELLEELYHRLLPWIPQLPNRNLYDGDTDGDTCPYCGESDDITEDGFYYTALSKYRQFHCGSCGAWLRASKRMAGVAHQAAVLL